MGGVWELANLEGEILYFIVYLSILGGELRILGEFSSPNSSNKFCVCIH